MGEMIQYNFQIVAGGISVRFAATRAACSGSVRFVTLVLVRFVSSRWVWFSSFCRIGFGSVRFAHAGLGTFCMSISAHRSWTRFWTRNLLWRGGAARASGALTIDVYHAGRCAYLFPVCSITRARESQALF
jgi:hypothetical protein